MVTRRLLNISLSIFLWASVCAQVPVREEPRHKVALQNKYVRLLDVRITPGDTSLYHVHETPSFFIPLSTTSIGFQIKGQGPVNSRFPLDSTWYNGFENGPLIHRVWNDDTNVLHVIDLELLRRKNSVLPAAAQLPFPVAFENDKLRVYKLEFKVEQHLMLPAIKTPMLLISEIGGNLQINTQGKEPATYNLAAGQFQWLAAQQKFRINHHGNTSTRCVLILLK